MIEGWRDDDDDDQRMGEVAFEVAFGVVLEVAFEVALHDRIAIVCKSFVWYASS